MCPYQIQSKPAPQGIRPGADLGRGVGVARLIVNRTAFGRYVYAIGGNPEAAALVGIPVKKVMLKSFLLLGRWSRWRRWLRCRAPERGHLVATATAWNCMRSPVR